jgi:chromatin remodeling complex protein RSC6
MIEKGFNMAKKVNAALSKPLQPSANLAAIVGNKALPRSQAIKLT